MGTLLSFGSFRGEKMAITDVMNELEKAVEYAKEKEATLSEATAAQAKAANEYHDAVSKVETLRTKLGSVLDDIMGSKRIRVAS